MFESLQTKLNAVFDKLASRGRLTEQDVDAALREVRLALLEADVNFKVVKQLVARVRERAIGAEVMKSLTPAQRSSRSSTRSCWRRWASRPSSICRGRRRMS